MADQFGSILCLPRLDSFLHDSDLVARMHPSWRLIRCPVCGDACYTSPDREQTLAMIPGLRAACTQCALRGGQ